MLRKFVYLLALVRERHHGRAAEACHVSQPTLTNAIRQLEEELGVPIVARTRTYTGLTPEGETVVAHARRMVAERDAMRLELAAAVGGQLTGTLRLGVIPTALPALPPLLEAFHQRHPHVRALVTSMSQGRIEVGLRDFDLDAGVTYLDDAPMFAARAVPLFTERHFLLCRRDDAPTEALQSGGITWNAAARFPLILLTPDMRNRRLVDAAFAATGHVPRPVVETNSILTLHTAVVGGIGASVAPGQLLLSLAPRPELVALELREPESAHPVGLLMADRDPPSPLARALAETAAEVADSKRIDTHADAALARWRRFEID